jgi:hypothetical protein
MPNFKDALELQRGDKFVYDERVYKAHSAQQIGNRAYIETATGTLITTPMGTTVSVQ